MCLFELGWGSFHTSACLFSLISFSLCSLACRRAFSSSARLLFSCKNQKLIISVTTYSVHACLYYTRQYKCDRLLKSLQTSSCSLAKFSNFDFKLPAAPEPVNHITQQLRCCFLRIGPKIRLIYNHCYTLSQLACEQAPAKVGKKKRANKRKTEEFRE